MRSLQNHGLRNLLHACLHHVLYRLLLHAVAGTHAHAPHQQLELSSLFVKLIQLARHIALVAEHVDQKTQRAQAIAHFFKQHTLFVLGHRLLLQTLYVLAHTHHGQRCLIKPQHREHTPHLRQMHTHSPQHRAVTGVAEILIQQFFSLSQRASKFPNDTAHGLLVAHLAVQLLHPRL